MAKTGPDGRSKNAKRTRSATDIPRRRRAKDREQTNDIAQSLGSQVHGKAGNNDAKDPIMGSTEAAGQTWMRVLTVPRVHTIAALSRCMR